ncbi:hypothetical protein LguiB_004741 [Lonicera macranthoides]
MEMAPSPLPQPPPPTPQVITKKLWNMVKVMFYMLRKGITKTKLLVDLQLTMLKRGKIASKAIGNLMLHHHYSAFASRTHNMSFNSRGEYEFSCSNSPVILSYFAKNKHQLQQHYQNQLQNGDINVAQKAFEILNNPENVEESPMTVLPGFGGTPLVRQLRITDSPFPLKEIEEVNNGDDHKVDKAAEDFIKKFYKELKKQASVASPSPYHMWAR